MRNPAEIAKDLVKRHNELKSVDNNPAGYGQDDTLYNLLNELDSVINSAKRGAAEKEAEMRMLAAQQSVPR